MVVGLGELLWDEFGDHRRPGGAPANVAFHATQLGCRGVVCSRVGRDEPGDALLAFLESQSLETGEIQRDAVHPTGRVTVDTSNPGHPTYIIHENVAWDFLEATDRLAALGREADAICFGTLAQRSATSRATIQRVLSVSRPDCLRVYDVNLRQHWYEPATLEASLAQATIVKLNHDEVGVLAPLLSLPAEPLAFARGLLEKFAGEIVCITRSENGCLAVSAGEVAELPGVPITVADAVGAGDAFTAAFIRARLEGWSLERTAEFANRVGALVASHPGAMPPLREFEALRGRGSVLK